MRRMMENFVVTFVAILLLCAMIFFIAFDNAKVTYNVGAAQLTDIPPSVLQEKKRRYETASSCLVVSDSSLLFSHDYSAGRVGTSPLITCCTKVLAVLMSSSSGHMTHRSQPGMEAHC